MRHFCFVLDTNNDFVDELQSEVMNTPWFTCKEWYPFTSGKFAETSFEN